MARVDMNENIVTRKILTKILINANYCIVHILYMCSECSTSIGYLQ